MTKKIDRIEIYYNNGEYLTFYQNDLDKIKELGEAMTWIERAKQVYENLKPLFREG